MGCQSSMLRQHMPLHGVPVAALPPVDAAPVRPVFFLPGNQPPAEQ